MSPNSSTPPLRKVWMSLFGIALLLQGVAFIARERQRSLDRERLDDLRSQMQSLEEELRQVEQKLRASVAKAANQ